MYQLQKIKKLQSGFTLIEIAIVLVIIGLLLGGVLKGQEMITSAKIKRAANDFQSISAAIYTYQDLYKALPGDDPNAVARWGVPVATGGTVGDGVIAAAWDSATLTDESRMVWEHLRQAELVSGSGTTLPASAFSTTLGVEDGASGTTGLNGLVICVIGVDGRLGEFLDNQADDGAGDTGTIRNYDTANAAQDPVYNAADIYEICSKF